MSNAINIVHYIPHGSIPDKRGFAPALVAQNIARHSSFTHQFIANKESNKLMDLKAPYGKVYYIGHSTLYNRFFKKILNVDPNPLYKQAAQLIGNLRPNMFHAHQLELPINRFRELTKSDSLPIFSHAHVVRQYDKSLGEADLYVAVSDFVREQLVLKGFPEKKICVVRNGIDTHLFNPISVFEKHQIQQRYGIDDNQKVLIFFGRKQEIKGFPQVLKVIQRLLQTNSELVAFVIGSTPASARQEPSFLSNERLLLELSNTKRFYDLPNQTPQQLASLLGLADIALLPSLAEPQGLAMAEACAAGCIVISSKVGGIPETIIDQETGFLLSNPKDEEVIYKLVTNLLLNLDSYEFMRIKARKRMEQLFDVRKVISSLDALYADFL